MRILLCVCAVLAGCGVGDSGPIGSGGNQPTLNDETTSTVAERAEQEALLQVSEIAERNDKEIDRIIKEGEAAGVEKEIHAAVGRLIVAGNARIVEQGQLRGAQWVELQVTGKTPTEIIAAFPAQ